MLLIPTGLEDRPLRGVPWVTLALMLVNTVTLTITSAVGAARSGEVEVLGDLVEKTLKERPYLVPPPRLAAAAGRAGQGETAPAGLSPAEVAAEQKALDLLAQDYLAALGRLPWHRFGFIPGEPLSWSLLTAMFVHAGWMHLLGNMLFLYVSGIYVEDVYGRVLFLGSYLMAGLAATLGHQLSDPQSATPLVGASGAIAGVMGILLVRLARSRIRFLFLPIPVLPTVRIPLTMPALVVLPLWLGQQLYFASEPRVAGGGVAWWAHVAGFVFGAALAGVIGLLGIEDRTQGRTVAQDEVLRAVDRAARAREKGDLERADAELGHALERDPNSRAAWDEAYELALERDDPEDLCRAMTRLLEILPRSGAAADVLALLEDERWTLVPERPARLDVAVAAAWERAGRGERALEHYERVVDADPRDPLALRALIRQGEILTRLGRAAAARQALQRAQVHPAMSDGWQAALDRARARLPA
jgi:membrane associated rhomboid family serine protease